MIRLLITLFLIGITYVGVAWGAPPVDPPWADCLNVAQAPEANAPAPDDRPASIPSCVDPVPRAM